MNPIFTLKMKPGDKYYEGKRVGQLTEYEIVTVKRIKKGWRAKVRRK